MATVKLLARNKTTNKFELLYQNELDPTSIFIDQSKLANNDVRQIQYKGIPMKK